MTKHKDKESTIQANEALVKIFDDLLENEAWESSQVLKVSAKKLLALRDEAAALLAQAKQEDSSEKQVQNDFMDTQGLVPLYVLVYQSGNAPIHKWHERICTLVTHYVGLPIFRTEAALKKMLRQRKNPDNYGYVEVWVAEHQILNKSSNQGEDSMDDLVVLHGRAIALDHIRWFCDGKNYFHFDSDRGLIQLEAKP